MPRKGNWHKASRIALLVSILAVLGLLTLPNDTPLSAAAAEPCTGTHSNSTFGNLVVPEGQTCKLDRFNVVSGDIRVERGATLAICPDNTIGGDIKAKRPDTVEISDIINSQYCGPPPKGLGVTIGGSITVRDARVFVLQGNPGASLPVHVTVEGDVVVVDTQSLRISDNNDLRGDVILKDNTDVFVYGNTITRDLRITSTNGVCEEHDNTVAGDTDTCP